MLSREELYQRVKNLSPSQRNVLRNRLQHLKTSPLSEVQEIPLSAPQRLIAFVVAAVPELDSSDLRKTLSKKLPAYMVPKSIVFLTSLPRTATGKIDINALPNLQLDASLIDTSTLNASRLEEFSVPYTPAEKILVQIWSDVLRVPSIGLHDNFFELGGDSILSIQIVSLARDAGLRLAPNQIFERPTITELAMVANLKPEVLVPQAPVTGPVPLTPIQHWFFEQEMVSPHHWHQARVLEVPPELSLQNIKRAIATLWTHHDALRLHFTMGETGWQQMNVAVGAPPAIAEIDLSLLSDREQVQAVAHHGSNLHTGITLSRGGLMRVGHFKRGVNRPSWLLISLHHLIVDAVSWQILYRDLSMLLATDSPSNELPAKTTAFQTWAEILVAQASAHLSEENFWVSHVEAAAQPLPTDAMPPLTYTEANAKTIKVTLDQENTYALLQNIPAVYNTQINDVLLTALAQTLFQWCGVKSGQVRVDVEAHGRELIAPDIDVSRTVGWFTMTYPITLSLADRTDSATSLKAIKEQLRQIPNRGIGYGLLRYLSNRDTQQRLAKALPSDLLFNYLGQRSPTDTEHSVRWVADMAVGVLRNPQNSRGYLLEVNGWITQGQLHLTWTYDTLTYRSQTMAILANDYIDHLKTIIDHCAQPDSGGFTPSDFPDVVLSQGELDEFLDLLN